METMTMFSRFMFLAPIGGSQRDGSHRKRHWTRPDRRPADRSRARFRLERLEERCLLSGISGVTSFATPTQAGPGPFWGVTSGPDGNVWFTETSLSQIAVINPTTDAISEFPTPTAGASPHGIVAGSDGNLWFTENSVSKIGMINPTTHAISEFPTPTTGAGPWDLAAGPDGNIWFTENSVSKVGMINPTTHAITEFSTPTASSLPYGITAGPDGNVWFTEQIGKIAMINPSTHAIAEFAATGYLKEIAAGPDGNLWFGSIESFNPSTHVVTQYATLNDGDNGITAGPDGNVWFTANNAPAAARNIGRINPATGAITYYPVNSPVVQQWGITVGPDGNLWFTQWSSRIDVATLNSSQLIVTQQPPASIPAGSSFGFTVTAEDNSGNTITSFNGTVTVALANNPNNHSGVTLGGTLSATASNGVATFSGLAISSTAAGYSFSLYASGGGYGWGVTNTITVTPAAASQLVITTQPPATVKLNTGFGFQASIEDQYGNVVTTASNTVSVAFANNPTGATLGGTLSVTASQGVAAFSNLTINKTGSGYMLQVSSSGLSSATTNPFNVTRTGHSPSPLAPSSATTLPDPSLAPLVLDSADLWDGLPLRKRPRPRS
jgi:virginiamycin B lyase